MKTTVKVIISALAAVAVAFILRAMYNTASVDTDGNSIMNVYQDMMVESRTMFVEKADDIQLLALALVDYSDLSIMSDSSGKPWVIGENGEKYEPEAVIEGELQPYLDNAFSEYACGGKLYNIKVTDKAVFFFTGYHESGSTGFLYEKELDSITGFNELLELTENWKIFYNMPEE